MIGKVRKAIFGVAAVVFVITFFLDGMFANTLVDHPSSPDPATRRIVPYQVKRVHVYISQDELNLTYLFRWIEIAYGVVIATNLALNLGWPWKSDRKRQ
jgi:hypothetical protein